MSGLRLALLIVGVAFIGYLYWQARRKSSSADVRNSPPPSRIEPAITDDEDDADPDADFLEPAQRQLPELGADAAALEGRGDRREPVFAGDGDDQRENERAATKADAGAAARSPVEQKIVSLRIAPKGADQLSGEDVILSLRGLGLQHGKFGIFHRLEGGPDNIVFSVASLVEPGSFDLKNIRQQKVPGLSIFLVRPGPGTGPEAFDQMIDAARTLARSLGGDLLDGEGSTLSIQRERYIREELIEYEHRVAHRRADLA